MTPDPITPSNAPPPLPVLPITPLPAINGKPIPEPAKAILRGIMTEAGVTSCTVTSVGRTIEEQARVMYENCTGTGVGQGAEAQLALYKEPGKKVVRVFIENAGKLPKDQVIQLMAAKIRELGPSTVSRHIADEEHCVFDVAPSSIPDNKKGQFVMAAKGARAKGVVSKFLEPPADPAYHFEIPKV